MSALAVRLGTTLGAGVLTAAVVTAAPMPVSLPLTAAQLLDVQLTAADLVLDLVRHGQSEDNAAGLTGPLGTAAPGVPLTDEGRDEAVTVGQELYNGGHNDIDGVYASDFLRTQQTAWPLVQLLMGHQPAAGDIPDGPLPLTGGVEPDHVLSGLAEVNAGFFNNTPEIIGGIPYLGVILAWSLLGQWWVPMLGSENNPNGIAFAERYTDAVEQIYANGAPDANGDFNDVAFSHGAAMLAWTLMTVKNPDLAVILTDPILPNTGQVVVEGNPTDGWTLVSWDGHDVAPTPDLLTGFFVDYRDLVTAPQIALWNIWASSQGGDPNEIWPAAEAGFAQVVAAVEQFPHAVIDTVTGAVGQSAADGALAAI